MNAIFSSKRFIQLVFSHWTEYRKRYLLFIAAMFGLMLFGAICILALAGDDGGEEALQLGMFIFAIMIAGCVYSGTFLSNPNDKSRGITYLLLPASVFEKLLCTLLFTIPLFFIVYTICFYVIDIPFVMICNTMKYQLFLKAQHSAYIHNTGTFIPYHIVSLFKSVKSPERYHGSPDEVYIFHQFLFMYFGLQAFFLMGSAYFKKFAFVKTLLSGFVLSIFYTVLTVVILKNHSDMNLFENYFRKEPVIDGYYYFAGFVAWFFKVGLGVLFYVITYFHIKEKEI